MFAFAIKCKSKMNKRKLKEEGVNTYLQEKIIEQGWNKRAGWKFFWKLINEQGGKKQAEGAKCWKLIKEHALLLDTWEYPPLDNSTTHFTIAHHQPHSTPIGTPYQQPLVYGR